MRKKVRITRPLDFAVGVGNEICLADGWFSKGSTFNFLKKLCLAFGFYCNLTNNVFLMVSFQIAFIIIIQ